MKVKELIRRLAVCNQEALLYVYDDQGKPEELNTITVGNNNDDIAMDYHLYHLNESENNKLMKPAPNYWILDNTSSTYEMREEIKSWGGYWVPDFKCWRIDGIEKDDPVMKVLQLSGLKLQRVIEK